MLIEAVKPAHIWLGVSGGAAGASFIVTAMPVLQFVSVLLSIAAGVKVFFGPQIVALWEKLRGRL